MKNPEYFADIEKYDLLLKKPNTDEEKISYIADRFIDIMKALGLDLQNESLAKTPLRIAKMYVNEIFSGLDSSKFPEVTFIKEEGESNVIQLKTNFSSFCEHHFVPFVGTAHIAYIPNGKLIGLSKIPRILRYFAKRPQLQERLTAQVADSLGSLLNTDDVAVSITAQHFCMAIRGIEDRESSTTTHVLRGQFESNPSIRQEFFTTIHST